MISVKKHLKIASIFILLFIAVKINGEEIVVFRGDYLTFGMFGGTQNSPLEIRYDTEANIYYLFYRIAVTETPVWIWLNDNDLAIFRRNLQKFIEWDAIARRERANISRELPDSVINPVNIIEGSGYGRVEGGNQLSMSFRFDTDTPATRRAGMPLLLIYSNRIIRQNAISNIITIQVLINLTSSQAQALLAGIEPSNMRRTIDRVRRQSDLFR